MNYKQKRLTQRQNDIQHEEMLNIYYYNLTILLGLEILITLLFAAFDISICVDFGKTIIIGTLVLGMIFIMFCIFSFMLLKLG